MSVLRKSLVALAAVPVCPIAPLRAAATDTGQLRSPSNTRGRHRGQVAPDLRLGLRHTDITRPRSRSRRRHHCQRRTASFSGLPKTVMAAARSEKGDYDGTQGPPPTGTPVTIYQRHGHGDGGRNRWRRHGHDHVRRLDADAVASVRGKEGRETGRWVDATLWLFLLIPIPIPCSHLHLFQLRHAPPRPIRRRRCWRDRDKLCGQTNFPTGGVARAAADRHHGRARVPSCKSPCCRDRSASRARKIRHHHAPLRSWVTAPEINRRSRCAGRRA